MEQLRHLLPFLRRYRRHLLLGLFCAICTSILTATIPLIIRQVVNDLHSHGVVAEELLRYGGLMLLIALIDVLFRFGQRIYIMGTSYQIEFDLRKAIFERLLLLEQQFYGSMHTGDLMARVTNDLSAIRQFLGPGLNSCLSAGLFIAAAAVLMFQTNITLTLIVLLLMPVVTVIFAIVGKRMQRIFRRVQDQFGDITTRAQENFSGIRTIKAYAQEDAELEVFHEANETYRRLNLRYVLMSGALWPMIALLLGTIAALVLLVGGQMVANGTLSLGDLVLFNTYLALLAWPMIALGWTVNLYQQASASMGRIADVLHRAPNIATSPNAPTDFQVAGEIEFRNVGVRFEVSTAHDSHKAATTKTQPALTSHTLPNDGWALRHISFSIPKGSSLAIVGATGAGKTTLINLLARVRDPDEGSVLVDGHDIRDLPLEQLRQGLGYVPQDTFLFSVPLRENVTFGKLDSSQEAIDRAARIAQLSNDLTQFPQGLDTMIGERGVTLSGGQKQRAAIARAVLREPRVLILDDALSSVDTHTAAEILAGLREVMQGRTSIIIAQRIATVKDADRAIVLHEGQIVEQGTHRELIQAGGRYAAMYRRELLEAELQGE